MATVLVASFLSYFCRRKASSKRHAFFSRSIMTQNVRFLSIITWTEPKIARKKAKETLFIQITEDITKASRTFAVLSFEFSNARAIVAIWKIFTCSVVFAGIVRAVIHLWEREEKTVRKRSEWCTDIHVPWKYLSLLCPLIEHEFRQIVKKLQRKHFDRVMTQFIIKKRTDRQTDRQTHTHTKKILTSNS